MDTDEKGLEKKKKKEEMGLFSYSTVIRIEWNVLFLFIKEKNSLLVDLNNDVDFIYTRGKCVCVCVCVYIYNSNRNSIVEVVEVAKIEKNSS